MTTRITDQIGNRAEAIVQLAAYSNNQEPSHTEAMIERLKECSAPFAVGELKKLEVNFSYEQGNNLRELWECSVELPSSPITRETRLNEIRRSINQWSVFHNQDDSAVRFRFSDNVSSMLPKIINIVNANIRDFNELNNTQHLTVRASQLRSLMQAIKDIMPEIAARGRTWDCSPWYQKTYTPKTKVYAYQSENPLKKSTNHDPDFNPDQQLVEHVFGVETKIAVEFNPLKLDIQETVAVSRERKRRYMLENL
jgi:hypothetical protein